MDKMRKNAMVLFLAFAIVLATLIGAAVAYDKNFTKLSIRSHDPIRIDGDSDFSEANGVVGGSGTETDPYIIEGWAIRSSTGYGISLNDTNSCVAIRNVSIEVGSGAYGYNKVGAGLMLESASNVTIENLEVVGFRVGIMLNGSVDARCANLAISDSRFAENLFQVIARNTTNIDITRLVTQPYYYESGILLDNCTDFSVQSCLIQQFGIDYVSRAAYGICVISSSNGNVEDNLIRWPDTYNAKGIWVRSSAEIWVSNNSLVDLREMSIWVEYSDQLSVVGNTIEGWDNRGITIQHSSDFLVADNEFCRTYSQAIAGLGVIYSENGTVRNNSLIECGGIGVSECSNVLVLDNLVDRARFGAIWDSVIGLFVQATNSVVSRNVVTNGSTTGIEIEGDNITVADNVISDNCRGDGAYPRAGLLASGTNLTIVGNRIRNNTDANYQSAGYMSAGLHLYACKNSSFRENNVSDAAAVVFSESIEVAANHFHGIWNFTFFENEPSANISFHGNSFFDNTSSLNYMTPGSLLWDAGYPVGGNYWSQYVGEDLKSGENQNQPGSDGIGDLPYELSTGQWDNYPLMVPTAIPDITSPITHVSLSGERGTLGWYKSSVTVNLSATDARGEVNTTRFSLDYGAWQTYSYPFQVTSDGRHLLEFCSIDRHGNVEQAKTAEVWIDAAPPFPLQTMKTEYRFKGVEKGYIYPEFGDNTSTSSYYSVFRAMGLNGYYTTCSFSSLYLYEGTKTYTIIEVDVAGNECRQNLTVTATPRPNTELLSLGGPYGPLYSIGLTVDVSLLIAAFVILQMSRDLPPPSMQKRDEGQRHYDEDVIDGYPKYSRRV